MTLWKRWGSSPCMYVDCMHNWIDVKGAQKPMTLCGGAKLQSTRRRRTHRGRGGFFASPGRGYNAAMPAHTPAPPLLAAKFHRPIAPCPVPRPALVSRLNDGLAAGRPLTLNHHAPAGYGKTMLAAQWTTQLNRPVAWLALDEADDDPLRFCTYFVGSPAGGCAFCGRRADPRAGCRPLPPHFAGGHAPQ